MEESVTMHRVFPSGSRKIFRNILLALICLAGFSLQSYLVTRPAPIDAAKHAWDARRGQELVLRIPDPKQAVFSHGGYANEYVNVLFEKARLAPATLNQLKRMGLEAPAGPLSIQYFTEVEGLPKTTTAEPGKTTLEVTLEGTGSEFPLLHLFQGGEVEDHPYLEMIAEEAALHVRMAAVPPENGNETSPGCRKSLWIGGNRLLVNVMPITIIAEPNSNVRFHFLPFKEETPLWEAGRPFTPFAPGKATVRPGDLPGFPLSELVVQPIPREGLPKPSLLYHFRSTSQQEATLRLEGLTINFDNSIQMHVTGRGWLTGDKSQKRVQEAVSLSTRLRNHVPLVAFFAGMDFLLLFASARRVLGRRSVAGLLGSGQTDVLLSHQSPLLITASASEAEMDLADLRERMTERLTRSELGTVWFDLLSDQMDDEMPGRPLSDCVIELLTRIHHRNLLPQLLEELRQTYPHVLNS